MDKFSKDKYKIMRIEIVEINEGLVQDASCPVQVHDAVRRALTV